MPAVAPLDGLPTQEEDVPRLRTLTLLVGCATRTLCFIAAAVMRVHGDAPEADNAAAVATHAREAADAVVTPPPRLVILRDSHRG